MLALVSARFKNPLALGLTEAEGSSSTSILDRCLSLVPEESFLEISRLKSELLGQVDDNLPRKL